MYDVLNSYTSAMANDRMNEIAMQPDAPFLSAGMDSGNILGVNRPKISRWSPYKLETESCSAVTKLSSKRWRR